MVTERNIKNSFSLVKNDLMKLQEEIFVISSTQSDILRKLEELSIDIKLAQKVKEVAKEKPKTKTKIITKTVTKKPKTIYIASKEGKTFHIKKCRYTQNIKPKSKIKFNSKVTALNQGYKPCNCVK